MPQSHKLPKLIFRYEGAFNFKELYHTMVGFFKSRDYDYIEKGWKEKEGSPVGREITVKMIPEKKISEYIKHEYAIEWKCVDAHTVTNEQGEELTHARFHLHAQATIIEDWQNLNKKKTWLGNLYSKYVFKRELDVEYMNALENEVQAFLDEAKAFVGAKQ